MMLEFYVRFTARPRHRHLVLDKSEATKDELQKAALEVLCEKLEPLKGQEINDVDGVTIQFEFVSGDVSAKVLDEVRRILRVPEKKSITDHATELMKGR